MEEGVVDRIRDAGGEIYAVTSEPQRLADQAREHWGLAFDTVGDPHQEIAHTVSQRGWLTLYAQDDVEFIQRGADWKIEHPKGFFQPGVLALTRERRVLYRWRSVPSAENLSGTVCRPTAGHVWKRIERALGAGDEGDDAAHDDHPEIDFKPLPTPVFVALLLANGWFLRVKSFAYSPGVPEPRTRFAVAAFRFLLFALAWIAAAVWLPTLPVVLALIVWAVWVVSDLRRIVGGIGRQRQLDARS